MALQMNYHNQQFDLTIQNCYWRISPLNGIRGGKEKIHVRISCFKSKEIADTNRDSYTTYDFRFTPDLNITNNFIVQAYDYAKSLDFFKTAIDI